MAVLIDGNNLQHAAFDESPERPIGRIRLCELLGQWGRRVGQRVSVVFDGPTPAGGLQQQFGSAGVTVRFSGAGVSADSVIGELIAGDSAPRALIVVSSDREVAAAARRRRARPVRSDEFWASALRELSRPAPEKARPEPREKDEGLSDEQSREWLRELGLEGADETDDPFDPRRY